MTPEKNILVNRKFDGAQEKADVRLITETGTGALRVSSSKETRSFVVHGGGVERLAPSRGEGVGAGPASWATRGARGETSAHHS